MDDRLNKSAYGHGLPERKHGLTGRMIQYVKDNDLMRSGDHVIVALSGGADSICLLYCLNEIKDRLGFTVSALHVEHGIRGDESARDAAFSESFCEGLDIEFTLRHIPEGELKNTKGLSLEEAARLRRYEFLEEERLRFESMADRDGRSLVAVAHHQDDQAETVLLNIFRGTGIDGVRGMLPARGSIIRPMLFAKRTEIEDFLKERGMDWCTDSTNLEDDQTRNKIRNQFLPYIESNINPQAAEHIAALAGDAREIAVYLEDAAEEWLERATATATAVAMAEAEAAAEAVANVSGDICDSLEIAISEIRRTPSLVVRMGLRRAMERLSHSRKDIGRVHLAAIVGLADKKVGSRLDGPYGITAERGYATIILFRKRTVKPQVGSESLGDGAAADAITLVWEEDDGQQEPFLTTKEADDEDFLRDGESRTGRLRLRVFKNRREIGQLIPKKKYTKWFDYDKMKNRPKIRYRMTGDKITLKGVGTKTVKSLMIDLRIPAKVRGRVPILADGESVIWVIGYRTNDDYLVTEDTEQILEAIYEPGEPPRPQS